MSRNKPGYKIMYALTFITSFLYILWRIFFTLPFGYGIVSAVMGILLLAAEIMGMIEGLEHCVGMTKKKIPERPEVSPEEFPDVDVFIATYNEPTELLYKTVNGCVHMDYPDPGKVHIFLCDDGHREEVQRLAEEMNVGYITRDTNEHAKAGNLNHAIAVTQSPLIVTFDADMIPLHDFLTATVPFFFREEKIGFIQTPQSFYNVDLFQYNLFSEQKLPNEQDYFFRDVNVGRNGSNSPIYAGSNTVISREALKEAGGIFTGVITEDFATGIKIQELGYACYAVDEIHAIGLAPTDLKSLIKQRERWARGCVQTFRKIRLWTNRKLSLRQKMGYTSCLLYWHTFMRRLIYILAPILFAVFGVRSVRCSLWELAVFWFPSYFLYNRMLKLLSGNIRTTRWSNVYDTIMMPSLLLPVLLETVGIKKEKFEVTKKDRQQTDKSYQYRKAIPHVVLAVLSVIGLARMITFSLAYQTIGYVVIIFWLATNLYNIIMAVFFMLSRPVYRMSERFSVRLPVQIWADGRKYQAVTQDISDGGFSFTAEEALYFKPDETYRAVIKGEAFDAQVEIRVMQVREKGHIWYYGVTAVPVDAENKSRYFRIIYDREPTLPKYITGSLSVFDDIYENIHRRLRAEAASKRKLPRIYAEGEAETEEIGRVEVKDFNYEYTALRFGDFPKDKIENLTLVIGNGVTIRCRYHMEKGNGIRLYRVLNAEEIKDTPEFKKQLVCWRNRYEEKRKEEERRRRELEKADYRMDEMKYL